MLRLPEMGNGLTLQLFIGKNQFFFLKLEWIHSPSNPDLNPIPDARRGAERSGAFRNVLTVSACTFQQKELANLRLFKPHISHILADLWPHISDPFFSHSSLHFEIESFAFRLHYKAYIRSRSVESTFPPLLKRHGTAHGRGLRHTGFDAYVALSALLADGMVHAALVLGAVVAVELAAVDARGQLEESSYGPRKKITTMYRQDDRVRVCGSAVGEGVRASAHSASGAARRSPARRSCGSLNPSAGRRLLAHPRAAENRSALSSGPHRNVHTYPGTTTKAVWGTQRGVGRESDERGGTKGGGKSARRSTEEGVDKERKLRGKGRLQPQSIACNADLVVEGEKWRE
ncbi:hypothetical protein B0H13DRAFT_1855092 [Mycena leptocephala]|nr:hypothetical protein B0H13DRAFT_1855092 [Mycena leptocephala]